MILRVHIQIELWWVNCIIILGKFCLLSSYYEGGILPYSNGMRMGIEQNKFHYDLNGRCRSLVNGEHRTAKASMVQNNKESFQPSENVRCDVEEQLNEARLGPNYHEAVNEMGICENKERDGQSDIQSKDFSEDSFVVYSSKNVILIKEPVLHAGKLNKPLVKYAKSKPRENTSHCIGIPLNSASKVDDTYRRRHVSTQVANFSSSVAMGEQQSLTSMENSAGSTLCSLKHNVINCTSDMEQIRRPNSALLDYHRESIESSPPGRKRCYSHPSCSANHSCTDKSKE